jgi:predicted metal-dependent hydrolase
MGSKGLLPMAIPGLCAYRREGFHPNQWGQPERAQSWLAHNQHLWAAVKQAPVL